jgi:hypothetical protein
VTVRGDDNAMTRANLYAYDDIVEALIRGDDVPAVHAPLATFTREVRALGEEPVPAPSDELTALLEGRPLGVVARVTGAKRLVRVGVGASLTAAGILGAGAVGLLPAAANNAVRGAIEVVTPVQFDEPRDHPENFGNRVSSDATGESDGENGVDGQEISDENPGADNRDGGSSPDDPPGQSGETGQGRADQTPAADAPGQTGADDETTDDEEQPGNSEQGQSQTSNSTVPPARTENSPPG